MKCREIGRLGVVSEFKNIGKEKDSGTNSERETDDNPESLK